MWSAIQAEAVPLFRFSQYLESLMLREGTYHNLAALQTVTEGDAEFEAILITTFVNEAPGIVESMESAYNDGDLETTGRQAHSLKPNAQMFGIDSIHEDLLFIEGCGKEDRDDDQLPALIQRVKNVVLQVVKELS
ncbi:Hpt domain-containing protein [Phaeocystidibacter marisrubri]|uniref:Hpt domain-containing protein n=2 Tax=Phaeocystidibacter marisrubri TaxID=1577780 RepID=A0A6L3ZFA3_9FLAO|nr:Hpt domain-containing protein [Phaeocystidibacter marisrubri]